MFQLHPLPPLPPASEVKTNTISMKQQYNHKKPEFLICTKRNISNIATYQPQPQLLTSVLSSKLQLLDPQTWSFISRDASGQMKCCHQGVVFLMSTCIQLHGEEAAEGGLCKTKDGGRSQFHSTISPPADKATMTVETRACHPKGTGPPLQVLTKQTFQTLSCLSKPFQAIPGKAKHADSGIELLQQIGAFSWSVSAVQEFCDSEFAEGDFSWIARIVMPGPQMIGSIFILYSPCLCLLTFALKFSTLYFSLSNLLFCSLKVS